MKTPAFIFPGNSRAVVNGTGIIADHRRELENADGAMYERKQARKRV
jgi:hypothetical protein